MKYTILKGFHLSNFIPHIERLKPDVTFTKHYTITFDESCKYETNEKSCVNKLCGWCYGLFGVHKNSDRIGWTYNKDTNKIDLWTYVYFNGTLKKIKSWECDFNKPVDIFITSIISGNTRTVIFDVNDDAKAQYYTGLKCIPKYIYILGFYFGGNTRAPHKMSITMK